MAAPTLLRHRSSGVEMHAVLGALGAMLRLRSERKAARAAGA